MKKLSKKDVIKINGLIKNMDKLGLITDNEAMFLERTWLKMFGLEGCYYPYLTEKIMIEDLKGIL